MTYYSGLAKYCTEVAVRVKDHRGPAGSTIPCPTCKARCPIGTNGNGQVGTFCNRHGFLIILRRAPTEGEKERPSRRHQGMHKPR